MNRISLSRVDLKDYKESIKIILNDEISTEKVIEYINSNREILSKGEYVKKKTEYPNFPKGTAGFMVPKTKYFVNLKLSTITIVLFLLDIEVTAGAASVLGGLFGSTGKSISRVSDEEKCIILDTSKREPFSVQQLNYENQKCTKDDLKCEFRIKGNCSRNTDEIEKLLGNLISKNVIEKNGNIYKLSL